MAETRTALGEVHGRLAVLGRQISSATEDAETYYGLGDEKMRQVAGLKLLHDDYTGLLAKLEA